MKFFYEKRRDGQLYFRMAHTLEFDAHMHESVELVFLIEGSAHAFAGGRDYRLSAGDFFVVFPNSIHYYDNCINNRAIVVIVPLDMLAEFRSILTAKSIVSSVVRNVDSRAADLLYSLITYDGKYKNEAIRGMLLAAFSMILEKADFSDKANFNGTTIESILEFCEKQYREELSLESVAKKLGISKSYISHVFTDKIHMSFRDYINSIRLNTSLHLLRQDKLNITDIASESGFGTVRTFNRAFKKKFGISPREYRILYIKK